MEESKNFVSSLVGNRLLKVFLVLLTVFIAVATVLFAARAYTAIDGARDFRETISISASGEIQAKPDVAVATISVMTEGKDPSAIQDENSRKINRIIEFLTESGVKKEDITTQNYNLYPRYDYNEGRQNLAGYTLMQSVVVKMRELDRVGDLMKGVVTNGANSIEQLVFKIDKPDDLRQEARKLALENAKVKAKELADTAGIKLGKIKSFTEGEISMPVPYQEYFDYAARSMGAGGGGSPDIQPGQNSITATVTVIFELK